MSYPVAVSIAGSDSGGGAGIQADIETFAHFDTHAATVITAITSQNPTAVYGISRVSEDDILMQFSSIFECYPVRAAKVGMLYSRGVIEVVGRAFTELAPDTEHVVVDPIILSSSGTLLIKRDAVEKLKEFMMHRASLVTPNLPELEFLLDRKILRKEEAINASRELRDELDATILLKGGHMEGDTVGDYLVDEVGVTSFTMPRSPGGDLHGTGCRLSAAITANLARGEALEESIVRGKRYLASVIENHVDISHGVRVAGRAASDLSRFEVKVEKVKE